MAASPEKMARRSLRSSYLTTIVSIFLVLFMLGLVGMLLLKANDITDHVKENLGFTVWLKKDVKEVDIIKVQKTLDATQYVKASNHVTAEEALKMLTFKYHHLSWRMPAKRYFIDELWQGVDWAIESYKPCDTDWKHYKRNEFCKDSL
mgnify:CR=1 FL=1